MSGARFSVVIPAYNAARTIGATIESVLAQTAAAHEIIVVDDGSSDNTSGIVARYAPNVRLIRQANGGPAAARNHAIREAAGDWIALLDSDDIWIPTKLARQGAWITTAKVGVVHCRAENHHAAGAEQPGNFETLWKRNRIATSTVLLRREAWAQVGGFDADRTLIGVEDYNLWLRLAWAGWEFAFCPETLARYAPAPGNLSGQTERFALAELANADNIAQKLNLAAGQLRHKRLEIHAQYGRDLLYYRQQKAARKMLAVPLRECPTFAHFTWWAATFVPRPLLDWRRKRLAAAKIPV